MTVAHYVQHQLLENSYWKTASAAMPVANIHNPYAKTTERSC